MGHAISINPLLDGWVNSSKVSEDNAEETNHHNQRKYKRNPEYLGRVQRQPNPSKGRQNL